MKIRLNFVSNSSSTSFILDKRYLTIEDINRIIEYCKKDIHCNEGVTYSEFWSVTEDKDYLKGFTTMDNGLLFSWIKENLNIPLKALVNYEKD